MATKRKREATKAPTEEEWNAQRDVLRELYFGSTLPKLMEHMEKERNFIASKNQYERKLKEWGFRKNLTSDGWEYVLRKKWKRDNSGKESQITLYGFAIPKERIKKEEGRHTLSDLNTIFSSHVNAPSPEAPEGISVSTPSSAIQEDFIGKILFNNLPYFGFLDLFISQGIYTSVSVTGLWATAINVVGHANPIRNVDSRLSAILPHQLNREFQAGTKDLPELMELDESAQYLILAMYFMSNNMLQDEDCSKVVRYFEHQRGQQPLKSLLSMKGSLAVDAYTEMLLLAATKAKNAMIIEELLKAKINPDNHKQVLHYAIEIGNFKLVRELIAAGADVNALAANHNRRTAIQSAARKYKLKPVRVCLPAGAHAPPADFQEATALQAAAEQGNLDLVYVLLAAGADVNAPPAYFAGATALQAAAKQDNLELVQVLLAAGADVNAPAACNFGRTALQAATEQDNLELVQFLLAAGADINAPAADNCGKTALLVAAKQDNLKLVQFLLAAGANINAPAADYDGRTALQAAAEQDNLELVQVLLAAGADVNAPAAEDGITALQAAAEQGNLELVRLFLAAGPDVNAPAASGDIGTALQAAAKQGNLELVQVLLAAGANVNALACNCRGRTALQAAAEQCNLELVRVLLAAGADVNAPPAYFAGATALQVSAIKGYIGIAILLLDAGAEVNARAAVNNGRMALEGAAEHGRLDMVQLLLNAGVKLRGSGDTQYRRALELASENGHNTVRRLIENHYESGGNE